MKNGWPGLAAIWIWRLLGKVTGLSGPNWTMAEIADSLKRLKGMAGTKQNKKQSGTR
jgi:hypothetical protein